jgi:UDP-N-acetylmuramate dehydrogenase
MHANYFVNTGGATADDVTGLMRHARRAVRERFGAELEPEVKLIGRRGEYATLPPDDVP